MKHSGKLQKSPAEMMNAEGKGAFAKVKITDHDMSEPYFVGAEKWILKNHPDYYMGYGVHQECPSGAFCASAVPCGEYPAGMYENAANRRKYAEMRAEQLGVEIGFVEHEASADKSLGTGNIYDTDFDIK
jgi:hypothetical protein